ncbi:MAG: 3-deoxy-D-arabino-heptulosonate 7-phosphate synthase [Opitutales bacterium]|nr:3-deoxy-D-arabino-heptulosonate 7-phosphate synthase [Opitutales bacterium]
MIISKELKLTDAQLAEVEAIVAEFDCRIQVIVGAHRCVYAILGDEQHELMFNRLIGLPYVDRVDRIESAYKLMDLRGELASHPIEINGCRIKKDILVIAGPCTVDPQNPNALYETAEAVKEAGAQVLRGGVWKPRTVPYSYQGDTAALELILEARDRTGLPLNIEVMDGWQLDMALEAKVEILQIGTRNALNYSLLKEIGQKTQNTETLVLLKRGRHMAPIDEFIAAAEYVAAGGNPNVMLCPRGTLPGLDDYRNHPDESIIPLLKRKTWAPVIYDPSHAVGRGEFVPHSSKAAIAYGADGLNIEAHIDPATGIGDDPKQAITPEKLGRLIKDVEVISSLGRS